MIGKLQGIVDFIGDGFVIIMTGGVGYKVFYSDNITLGDNINLWIETIVREDSIRLFGFKTLAQNDLFNQLTNVSGVGPKVGMSIIASIKPDILLSAIASGDAKTIATAPGVGKKMADKIILEMRSKVGSIAIDSGNNNLSDLLSALETLGYRRIDVSEIAQNLVKENPDYGIEKLVPMALKQITK